MKSNSSWRIRLAQILLGVAIVIALVVVRGTKAGNEPVHLTTDWSHRHLVFSAPQNLGQHVHLLSSPRYVQQLLRRNFENKGNGDGWRWSRAPEPNVSPLQGDWSMDMGAGATVGAGNYPAKYSFDPTSANCATPAPPAGKQPDFVVYNTSLPGGAATDATQTVTFGFNFGTPAGNVTIGGTLVLTASTTLNTGLNFLVTSDFSGEDANATNLAAAIARNGSGVGVTATSSGAVVTITALTAGSAGNSITLTGTLNGSNGAAFGGATLAGGANPQATIGAFDNLYSSCTAPYPATYWAYNTGTGAVVTSTVLSGGGDQVAFIQNTGATATLVLLKWKANDGNFVTPTTLANSASASAYNTCSTPPCMWTITFSNLNGGANASDTNSSPFYDYVNDVLYVGNDNGYLHKFTPVFKGAPIEVTSTAGATRWPASVNSGGVLTSPVFDDGIGKIFVGSSNGTLYNVDSTIGSGTGGITNSGALGTAGIDDAPVLDPTLGNVYVFLRGDEGGGGAKRAGVYRCTTALACTEAVVSSNSTLPTTAFYAGDFDNTYYTSANGTGNMYVCSTNGGLTALWRIPISAGAMGTPGAGPTLTTANVACSPVTEFYNSTTATDLMFLSVTGSAQTNSAINCQFSFAGIGCIMSFNITAPGPTQTAATAIETGGTSGIIVDGSSPVVGASQVYFTPLADQNCTTSRSTGGCAIQASQSTLAD